MPPQSPARIEGASALRGEKTDFKWSRKSEPYLFLKCFFIFFLGILKAKHIDKQTSIENQGKCPFANKNSFWRDFTRFHEISRDFTLFGACGGFLVSARKLDLAIGVSVGSSTQIALFVVPVPCPGGKW